jgi:hypothetical protein
MEEFPQEEQLAMPELNERVRTDLVRLQKLAEAFVFAQKELESDEFGTGSLFISHVLTLEHRLSAFKECQREAHDSASQNIYFLRSDYEWECDVCIMMAFLNPSVQFRVGCTCSQDAYDLMRDVLAHLAQAEIERDVDQILIAPDEPASDDFHSFVPSGPARLYGEDEQISMYARTRASVFHRLSYWQSTPAELKHLMIVALKVLRFLSTSASVESAFSIARSVTSDFQMAMKQETMSVRVMIQANWRIAQPLLADVLAVRRAGWSRACRELEGRKLAEHEPWRLGITEAMEAGQVPNQEGE